MMVVKVVTLDLDKMEIVVDLVIEEVVVVVVESAPGGGDAVTPGGPGWRRDPGGEDRRGHQLAACSASATVVGLVRLCGPP